MKYLAALGFIAIGMCLYTPFVYYKKRPRIMSTNAMEQTEIYLILKFLIIFFR